MFKIIEVELTNFRSFVGTHLWSLDNDPGLYFMTGENHENIRLDRNATGKSSLLDAICWCLYDRTTRLLRGNDVVNYNSNSCRVRIDLNLRGNIDSIITTQNPNSIKLNGTTVDRKALVKHLGLNFQSFIYAVIIPQFGDSFFDKQPGEKLTLFSEIMELDYWLEKSKQADSQAKDIEKQIVIENNQLSKLEGHKLAIQETIKELEEKSKKWEDDRKAKITEYWDSTTQRKEVIRSTLEKGKALKEELSLFPSKLCTLRNYIWDKQNKLESLDAELREVSTVISVSQYGLSEFKKQKASFGLVGAECPVCYQKVDPKHLSYEISKCDKEIDKLLSEMKDYDLVKKEVESDRNKIIAEIKDINIKLDKVKYDEWKTQEAYSNNSLELKYAQQDLSLIEDQIAKIKNQKNEFEELIEGKKKDYRAVLIAVDTRNDKVKELNSLYTATHYWVSGFKQIRLHIIEETLTSLEIEVNNNLAAMGMTGWTVQFDTERENKSGGITRGFSVIVIDPTGRSIKYEALSGGEGQRVRLAGCFGLANLIMEQAGLISHIEFYDEISQHLSGEGITDMLDTLYDRATTYNRQILVVDHHSLSYGNFKEVITVVKDSEGSRIVTGKT